MNDKYWSEMSLIQLIKKLNSVENNQDKQTVKCDFINYLQIIENIEIKRLFVYVSDEYLVSIFNSAWCDYLLEIHFFNTCAGGQLFFKYMDKLIKEQNIEMTKLYLLSIKFGFKGSKENPNEEYNCVIEKLFPREKNLIVYEPYKTIKREIYNNNFFFVFFPIFFIYILISIWELITIKTFNKSLNNLVNLIYQGVL